MKEIPELWTFKASVNKTEIITTFQIASLNLCFSVGENLTAGYQMQFPDSVIAKNMTMSSWKMSYVIGYELESYFMQMTVKEIMEGPLYFTLYFGEAATA